MEYWLSGVLALLVVVVAYSVQVLRLAYDPDLRKIPGPFWSRFTVWPLKIQVITGRRTHYIHRLHQIYGPVVRIAPFEVAFADIKAYREIHKIGTPFTKAAWYQSQSPVQYSDDTCGVFGVRDNRKAAARRKLYQQAGTKVAVKDWEPLVSEIVRQAVQKIKRDAATGSADLVKWWSMMTADVLGTIAFGEPFRVIEKEEKTQMMVDIETSMIFVGLRMELPLIWALVAYLPLPGIGRPMALFPRFEKYGQTAVRNTKAASKSGIKTLFHKMLPEDGAQPFPDSLIVMESANIIIAGSDTTATVLTYLVFEVLSHPDVKQKLLDELRTCSPNPRWEELESKQYLNNVITETLRLHPAVPASLPRTAPAGGHVLAGYHVPGGCTVVTQAHTFHRDPHAFEAPTSFDPGRWLQPTDKMKEYFMPWGGQARVCLGQNVARMEILHAVCMFFRECPDAKIGGGMTQEKMENFVDYFTIKPEGGKFEITSK